MKPRKKCQSCGTFLMSFMGSYMHPDTPCAGVRDSIDIEAEIQDDALHKIFIKLYGEPEINDYDLLAKYEEILKTKQAVITDIQTQLNNPLIRFVIKIVMWYKKKFG